MELIDTHTHIYIDDFQEDHADVMHRAEAAGVTTFYLPAIDSSHTQSMMAIESPHIRLMMGLHPCSVKPETYKEELAHVKEWVYKRPFAAVGEIGIDLHWDTSTQAIQVEAFEKQIEWAIDLDLPIVIHSRKSTNEVIALLRKNHHPKLRGIFHCFGGSVDEANAITELGFKLGIGGVVTFKNAGLDKTVAEIDLAEIVLETDAPYLSPSPYRGKRNEPSYLRIIAEKIAELKNISVETVAEQTSATAKGIFGY